MSKAEKRAFKLFAKRGGGSGHLFLKLFDLIDKVDEMDDEWIIKKMKLDSSIQYSNLKRHLYSQILNSLRMLNVDKKPNIKIREYIDKAYVLYGKGLYMQALNLLAQAKQLCEKYGTDLSLLTILEIEKNIHSRHITRERKESIENLLSSTEEVSDSISHRVNLTNLKIKLHSLYLDKGHIYEAKELLKLSDLFNNTMSSIEYNRLGTLEKVYYCQCYVWYNYIVDDFKSCLKYAKQWVQLFKSSKDLQRRDYNLYLRGFHYILASAFNIKDRKTHQLFLEELEVFRKSNYSAFNKNNKIFSFLYVHTARLNKIILSSDFESGLKVIPRTLSRIKRYERHLDPHKIMVLHYKIAWIYICSKKPQKAIPFLEGIIKLKRKALREDIQSYARLMHLMALYNIEDFNELLKVSKTYSNYFNKAKEVNLLQEAAIKYFIDISKCPILERKAIHNSFLAKLEILKKDKSYRGAFLYLDVFFWLKNYT